MRRRFTASYNVTFTVLTLTWLLLEVLGWAAALMRDLVTLMPSVPTASTPTTLLLARPAR